MNQDESDGNIQLTSNENRTSLREHRPVYLTPLAPRNKKLLVAKGIATRSKKLLGSPGLTTSNKNTTRGSWHCY